jgi:hypothetical protein
VEWFARAAMFLSLHAYVQLPQHVSDELLHVLMATVVEGDARALSVGQWCGGHDPIRIDDDGLIVRLRKLHECHERSILAVWAGEPRAAPGNLRRAGAKVKPVYRKRKGEALQMACGVCARSTRRDASRYMMSPAIFAAKARSCSKNPLTCSRPPLYFSDFRGFK